MSFAVGQLELLGFDFFISKITSVAIVIASIDLLTRRPTEKIIKLFFLLFFVSTLSGLKYTGFIEGWFDLEWFLVILILDAMFKKFNANPALFEFYRRVFMWSGFIFSLILLIYGDRSWENRNTLFGLNQNYIGILLSLSIFELIHFRKEGKLNLVLFSVLLGCAFAAIITTGSRSGLVAAVLGSFIIVMSEGINIRLRLVVSLRYFSAAGLLGLLVFFVTLNEELNSRLLLSLYEGDLSGRDLYWMEMPRWVGDNWLLGIGNTGLIVESLKTYGAARNPHNLLVEYYVRAGVIGLFVLVTMTYHLIKKHLNFKARDRHKNFLALFFLLSSVAHPLTTIPLWLYGYSNSKETI